MIRWVFIFCFLSSAAPANSQTRTTQAHSTASFVSSHRQFVPGNNKVGLHISLEPEWHTYWANPGDSAAAPIMDFQLPAFARTSAVIYPTPRRIPFGPLQSFGYENEVLLMFDIFIETPPPGVHQVEIVLNAEWLVCKEECIPGVFRFSKTMDLIDANPTPSAAHSLFMEFHKSIPTLSEQTLEWGKEGDSVTLSWDPSVETPKDIFPLTNQLVDNEPPEIAVSEARFSVSKAAAAVAKERFLFVYADNKSRVFEAKSKSTGLLLILVMAFLGGLILNIMPCVLPILSLKAMMLVQSRDSGYSRFVTSNLLYALGVVASFALFAMALIGLNASGQQLGWGFQLQSPFFVSLLIVVFLVMGLMFLDLLPVSFARLVNWSSKTSGSESDWKSSLMTGVLAVVVASPCTAPFMGAAMGYSLGQPPHVVLAIFLSLGLGLAFPFLAICLSPKALQVFPRPGTWMVWVKKLMAIPMFLTVVWLAWVLHLQVSGPSADSSSLWESYDPAKLETYKNDDRPVFFNATAAWCISCQVNEAVVFQTNEVKQYFQQRNFHLIKADWTNKDAEIASLLRKYNRVGVPLYLYFPPGQTKPTILPEVLTVKSLLSTLGN